jgi:hypothetical protein
MAAMRTLLDHHPADRMLGVVTAAPLGRPAVGRR